MSLATALDSEAAGKPLYECLLAPMTLANLELARGMSAHGITDALPPMPPPTGSRR